MATRSKKTRYSHCTGAHYFRCWAVALLRNLLAGLMRHLVALGVSHLGSDKVPISKWRDKSPTLVWTLKRTCSSRSWALTWEKKVQQGNYSLRRPPKLILPQIFIEQRWATVYSFMCKQICISNKANMTRALMRVKFWVNGQYSPRTEPTERVQFWVNGQYSARTEPTEWPIFIHWGCWTPITAFKPW